MHHEGLNTTILAHLFGQNTNGVLSFAEFEDFVKNLQKEIYHAEFMDYSMGTDFISAEDFARIILRQVTIIIIYIAKAFICFRYTSFTGDTKKKYLKRLTDGLKKEERNGISFEEFECFCRLLQNIKVSFSFNILLPSSVSV